MRSSRARAYDVTAAAVLIGAIFTVAAAVALLFLAQPIYQRLAYGDSGATPSRITKRRNGPIALSAVM